MGRLNTVWGRSAREKWYKIVKPTASNMLANGELIYRTFNATQMANLNASLKNTKEGETNSTAKKYSRK